MTLKAKTEGKVLSGGVTIRYNKTSLHRWFKSQGGKDKSAKEKPFLSADQKRERKKWCHKEKKQKADAGSNFHACFIDEKWFYTTSSRRRRLKILPAGDGEDPDKVAPHIPTTLNRRWKIYRGAVSYGAHELLHSCSRGAPSPSLMLCIRYCIINKA